MVTVLNLIHLSDFHSPKKRGETFSKFVGVTSSIISSLADSSKTPELLKKNYQKENVKLKNVFLFTGDISDKGQKDEFSVFKEYVYDGIREQMSDEENYFFFTPGNHDFNEKSDFFSVMKGRNKASDWMSILMEEDRLNNHKYDKLHDKLPAIFSSGSLKEPFINYYKFADKICEKNCESNNCIRLDDGEGLFSLYRVQVEDVWFYFLSLNSAYIHSKIFGYEGYIGGLHRESEGDQLYKAMTTYHRSVTELFQKMHKIDPVKFSRQEDVDNRTYLVSIYHHPFEAIIPRAQFKTFDGLAPTSDIILNGHGHYLKSYINFSKFKFNGEITGLPFVNQARCFFDINLDDVVRPGYMLISLIIDVNHVKGERVRVLKYETPGNNTDLRHPGIVLYPNKDITELGNTEDLPAIDI